MGAPGRRALRRASWARMSSELLSVARVPRASNATPANGMTQEMTEVFGPFVITMAFCALGGTAGAGWGGCTYTASAAGPGLMGS